MKITEESMKQTTAAPDAGTADSAPAAPKLTEREKLKAMNRRDRLWYIWAYYKLHIIGGLLGLVLLYAVGLTVYNSTFETELHCMFLNNPQVQTNMEPLEQDFAEYLGLGKKQLIVTESTNIAFGDQANELSFASMAKITALTASQDLDVVVSDTVACDAYAVMGAYADLETFLPPELLETVKDRLYYAPGDDGVSRAYAVDVSGTEFADRCGLALKPSLCSVVSNSVRTDTATQLLRYIFAP